MSTGRMRPRLVLCATGAFSHVPLHAASTSSQGCWDYFVPSYTPTLGALLAAQRAFAPMPRKDLKTLLAAVPVPFKWDKLYETVTEVKMLQTIVPASQVTSIPLDPSATTGTAGSASCDEVFDMIPQANILHLACHGYHNATNPMESGFVMRDKMLTLMQLMGLNLPNAFFAFLSACETARAPQDQPDQAVHLAATMMFTGFKSVIGTV